MVGILSLKINKIDLTLDELRSIFRYNSFNGKIYWIKAPRRGVSAGSEAGFMDKDGYKVVGINKKEYKVHRLVHYIIHGYDSENQIDHKDNNKSNNRPDNLREANSSCNQINTKTKSNNTSGVVGVSWEKSRERWRVQVQRSDGRNNCIGRYKNFDDAVMARYKEENSLYHYSFKDNSSAYIYLKENGLLEKGIEKDE